MFPKIISPEFSPMAILIPVSSFVLSLIFRDANIVLLRCSSPLNIRLFEKWLDRRGLCMSL